MQFPGPTGDWQPIAGSQFIDANSSTALTIPSAPTGGGASRAGINYVAVVVAQGSDQWIREDGSAVTASYTGGKKLSAGDWQIVYGLSALKALRVINGAPGSGSLAVTYYWYR